MLVEVRTRSLAQKAGEKESYVGGRSGLPDSRGDPLEDGIDSCGVRIDWVSSAEA